MSNKIILTDKQLEDIRSLREYLITTSKIPELYEEVVGLNISSDIREAIKNPKFFYHGSSLLYVWLGMLNSVIEGWFTIESRHKLRIKDETIVSLIGTSNKKSENAQKLEDFRHSVFHFQTEKKPLLMDFTYNTELLKWSMKVNLEFEKWFDYYFTANTLPRNEPHYEWFKNSDIS